MRHMPIFIAKIGESLWRAAHHRLPPLCKKRPPNVCVMQTYRRGRGDFMDYHTDSRQTYAGQKIAQACNPTHPPHTHPHSHPPPRTPYAQDHDTAVITYTIGSSDMRFCYHDYIYKGKKLPTQHYFMLNEDEALVWMPVHAHAHTPRTHTRTQARMDARTPHTHRMPTHAAHPPHAHTPAHSPTCAYILSTARRPRQKARRVVEAEVAQGRRTPCPRLPLDEREGQARLPRGLPAPAGRYRCSHAPAPCTHAMSMHMHMSTLLTSAYLIPTDKETEEMFNPNISDDVRGFGMDVIQDEKDYEEWAQAGKPGQPGTLRIGCPRGMRAAARSA